MTDDKKINKTDLPEPQTINEPALTQEEFIDNSNVRVEGDKKPAGSDQAAGPDNPATDR
jgi:hypothetical protein